MTDPPAIANRLNPNRSEDFVALSIIQDRFPLICAGREENDWIVDVRRRVSEMPAGGHAVMMSRPEDASKKTGKMENGDGLPSGR